MKVESPSELLKQLLVFGCRLGFDKIGAMVALDHAGAESECHGVDNMPPACEATIGSVERSRHDPVMQHCKHRTVPIVWDQRTYVGAGRGEMWEEQAQYGYCSGIAAALHLPHGRHFFIGVDRGVPLPRDPAEVTRITASLQLFTMHALDPATRILLPEPQPNDLVNLTSRERECLCWTMEGKTAWEVGNILSISEQTAARHVNNATQKLGCVNKLQAVVKALRLGLVH